VTDAERRDALDIDGRQFSCRTIGSGPPLVLLNGYSATAMDWDPVMLGVLAESFEVICPDNRGVGESAPGTAEPPLTIELMAGDVEAMLDERGIDRVPIVGWSMGGFIAQSLARRSPERFDSVVLMGTDGGGPTTVRARPEDWAQLTDHSGTFREQAARLIALLFPPPVAPMIDQAFGDIMAEARAALSIDALVAQERAMEVWHTEAQAPPDPASAPPVLVLSGQEDVVIPAANDDVLAQIWPKCEVERYEGGHAFFALQGAPVAERIVSFCRGA
jgi:pimeloyl-ACP methyl ester carboxylesterase